MRALFVLLCVAALATSHAAAESGMDADFAWFSTLGFPDVKNLEFVRYGSGAGVTIDGKSQELWPSGFLLEETPTRARILTLDLTTQEIAKDRKAAGSQPRFAPDDLRAVVEDILAYPPERRVGFAHYHRSLGFGPNFAERTHLFVLAWMCQQQGLPDLAARLYAAAQQTKRSIYWAPASDDTAWSFRDKLERDIGGYEMSRASADFGDLKISRRELLARYRSVAQRYSHCDHLADAQRIANQLARMVAEDDVHPVRPPAEISKLPSPAEQAQEWIYALRDQDGGRWGKSAGYWMSDIFESPDDRPAHRLVKLGDAAVPGLIAAFDDTRFTRSASYGAEGPVNHILTIGEAALEILERIAGHPFDRSGLIDRSRAAVSQWWSERQAKGVPGELAATTARGVYESMSAADQLLAKYPEAAATPILAGAAATQDASERSYFMRLVGKLKDDRAAEFLLREARGGPFFDARVEAAWQLGKLGRADGLPLMIAEWRSLPPFPRDRDRFAWGKLITLLTRTDSPNAMRALTEGLRQRSPEVRDSVLLALTPRKLPSSEFGDFLESKPLATRSPATQQVIEDLAASEAGDSAAYFHLFSSKSGRSTFNPCLCDDAAALLAAGWPDRYRFDITASYPVRERARIACLNVWREKHGQPALPMPPERLPVAPGDEFKIAEVVLAGEDSQWPDALRAMLHSTREKAINPALFVSLERGFLEASHGSEMNRGFYFYAFRENATDGITLLAGPMPPNGAALPPNRQWRLDLSTAVTIHQGTSGQGNFLLGQDPLAENPRVLPQFFEKIMTDPADTPFSVSMELTPAP